MVGGNGLSTISEESLKGSLLSRANRMTAEMPLKSGVNEVTLEAIREAHMRIQKCVVVVSAAFMTTWAGAPISM